MSQWNTIRQQVLNRDNHKCRYLQCNAVNRLHIHHINKNGNDKLDNLITLCGKHHKMSEPIKKAKLFATTTVQLNVTTREKLSRLGKHGESYDDIINRLLAASKK